MATDKVLNHGILQAETVYMRPAQKMPASVSMTSRAVEAMTDLTQTAAVTISPCATLDECTERMIASSVRLLFVVNQFNHVIGIITSTDLTGQRPMQYLQEVGGKREDIMVRDIMVPQSKIEVLKMEDVNATNVGDIVATLKRMGRQHALVVEMVDGREKIRGIFSTKQIATLLNMDISTADVASSIADMAARA